MHPNTSGNAAFWAILGLIILRETVGYACVSKCRSKTMFALSRRMAISVILPLAAGFCPMT
ncbi:hypothetical protein, partial [Paracoccus sp. (in: a-proteobacteria)]|uniref:hypothetical protein n=1 Tax=Paracoccus sp. TaxID=267 RepID=UPI0028AA95B9